MEERECEMHCTLKKQNNKQNGREKKGFEKLNYKEENSEEFMRKVLVRCGRILNTICVSYLKMYCIQKHSF